ESLPIPGHTETLSIVQYGRMQMPVLKITQRFSATRFVSAFLPVLGSTAEALAADLTPASTVEVALTNGTQILAIGDVAGPYRRSDTEFITSEAFAGEIPIRARAAVPFEMVRANHADLDASFTIVACLK